MVELSIAELGARLTRAGKLSYKPICVYGSETIPDKGVPIVSVNRCIARALLTLAVHDETPPLYIGDGALDGCCPGGQGWLGFSVFPSYVKYFVSTGSKDVRNGAAEFLKRDPNNVERTINAVGTIRPLGKYIVLQTCEELRDEDPGVKSIVCIGKGEQIRNLCALVYFRSTDPFYSVVTPWGPSCATFITYPTGMAENTPIDTVFTGPVDPTGNLWFPPDCLAISIPVSVARCMSEDLERSFLSKRPNIAYPDPRIDPKTPGVQKKQN